ncbi:MAG: hypothetical protein LBK98_08315 [Peptococcaceae bacterium]|jgi:hypothetical protein|nr:hypothetical protein [Peptococcaceae bacterium]
MINNLALLRQEGLKALNNKLGAAGTVIFIRQFENGYGDYTNEREIKLKDVTLNDIVSSIRKRKVTK